jgi:chromosome segregation protein
MRLQKIRLSGFKSFADPCSLDFPKPIVAVTGPNGSGKSNLIDAVRWVLGESSAKNLRGEAMPDVIFNGSKTRERAGRASVELVFDNSDGRLAGEYGAFSEISVRREVGRDGISQYYLNGTLCLRRNITDLFLGTGLGPRSYAIIEQGTISRLIDLHPEEWQGFLEEAAGVSKYKERRRETLAKIEQTTETLESVREIRDQHTKRLAQLAQQARQAERFRTLRETRRLQTSRLFILQKREFSHGLENAQVRVREEERNLEQVKAAQAAIERQLIAEGEKQREVISAYQEAQTQCRRLEQKISETEARRKTRELEQRHWIQEHARLEADQEHLRQRLAEENANLKRLTEALRLSREAHATAREASVRSEAEFQSREEAWHRLEERLAQLRENLAQARQDAEISRVNAEHLGEQKRGLEDRLQDCEARLERIETDALSRERNQVGASHEAGLREKTAREAELAELKRALDAAQVCVHECEEGVRETEMAIEQGKSRLLAQAQLRAAALAFEGEEIRIWLEQTGLSDHPRLVDLIQVEPGLEASVQAVLGERLKAICVERLDPFAESLADLAASSVMLVEQRETAEGPPKAGSVAAGFGLLVGRTVEEAGFMAGVRRAPSVGEALSRRSELGAPECWVTPEGVLVGPNWMAVRRGDRGLGSLFAYDREIHALEERQGELDAERADRTDRLQESQVRVAELARRVSGLEGVIADHGGRLMEVRTRLIQLDFELAEGDRKREEALKSRQDLTQRIGELGLRLSEAAAVTAEAEDREVELEAEVARLAGERDAVRAGCEDWSRQARELGNREREMELASERLAVEVEAIRSRAAESTGRLEELHEQARILEQKRAAGAAVEAADDAPERWVAELQAAQERLESVRATLDAGEGSKTDLERSRVEATQHYEAVRGDLERCRLEAQDWKSRLAELETRAERSQCDWSLAVAETETAGEIEREIEILAHKIERLGEVNLRAPEDYETERAQEEALDAQIRDITEGLTLLQEAIRKIDLESRTRFDTTFREVNLGLRQLFPRLFGGGQAELRRVGEDEETAGVELFAWPPGKRPVSISQLSGGEKALTAIAVVFAIFRLNPAPFCMLDEVDAPMDESSILRFAALVRELSEQLQIILISHNKLFLETAEGLVGVTMQEPGVSRIVSVDLDEAVRMAEQA